MDTKRPSELIPTTVQRAYNSFIELSKCEGSKRNRAVELMATGLKKSFTTILEANSLDLEIGLEMAVPELIKEWLKLSRERLDITVEILERIARLDDPIKRVINASYQPNPAQTYCQLMPLGVIALVYETFPDLGAIAAAMSIKTSNAMILRGCSFANHSNTVIGEILQNALEQARLPLSSIQILSPDQGSSIQELIAQDEYINLVIPYGRPNLVSQVTQAATAPVLKSAMGNCYLYWSESGDLEMVRSIIIDSHESEPDPVNAIEKVLIHSQQKHALIKRLFNQLKEHKFQLRGDSDLLAAFPEYLVLAENKEWGKPYLSKTIAFSMVDDIQTAIARMNRYSSSHADCLVTESYQESRQFATEIDSALVYINSSPRFSRIPKGQEAVFLGMSNQKGQRRGLIGLESFTTIKQVVQGDK